MVPYLLGVPGRSPKMKSDAPVSAFTKQLTVPQSFSGFAQHEAFDHELVAKPPNEKLSSLRATVIVRLCASHCLWKTFGFECGSKNDEKQSTQLRCAAVPLSEPSIQPLIASPSAWVRSREPANAPLATRAHHRAMSSLVQAAAFSPACWITKPPLTHSVFEC